MHSSSKSSRTPIGIKLSRKAAEEIRTAERRNLLEADPYIVTGSVRKTRVECVGCGKKINLDKCHAHYTGLWSKHRRSCPSLIEKGLTDKKLAKPLAKQKQKRLGAAVQDATVEVKEHQQELWRNETRIQFEPLVCRSTAASSSVPTSHHHDLEMVSVDARQVLGLEWMSEANWSVGLLFPMKWQRKFWDLLGQCP
ncbi:hypothetical protein C8J56DRAFT_206984 [Mycena floridula]|nr:hypothetical protein C8J56DRAFT_206984 [Mycena floridula]